MIKMVITFQLLLIEKIRMILKNFENQRILKLLNNNKRLLISSTTSEKATATDIQIVYLPVSTSYRSNTSILYLTNMSIISIRLLIIRRCTIFDRNM